MKNINTRTALVLILISMLLLVSCGSSDKLNETVGYTDQLVAEDEFTEKGEAIGTGGENTSLQQNAKIIRNVSIDGETKDFDSADEAIKKQTSENGGYIEKSNISGGESLSANYRTARNATYIIRIPAEKLDSFLQSTESLLNIISSSESTTDVTLDYYDIESRLTTLESKKVALEAMLEKAQTLDEILLIQDNLYAVIADIESYQSQLNVYDNKVNYSTVNLDITEVVEYTVIEEEEPTFGERISEAFTESWINFGEFCQDLAVFIVSALPVLMFPFIAGIIVLMIWLIRRKKQPKKNTDIKDNNKTE